MRWPLQFALATLAVQIALAAHGQRMVGNTAHGGIPTAASCTQSTPRPLPEKNRAQLVGGFSVCFPAEPYRIQRRSGAGLERKTPQGGYYACYTNTRSRAAASAGYQNSESSIALSESILMAISKELLDEQTAQLTHGAATAIVREEPVRVGIHHARKIIYPTQAFYGSGTVNAYTLVVALVAQGLTCQFTFIPTAASAAQAEAFADYFFATIRPEIQPALGAVGK